MNNKNPTNFAAFESDLLKDPEIRKDYDALKPKYDLIMRRESLIATRIKIHSENLSAFCRRNHIKKLSLFGSVLRDDFRHDSDIDILVEFEAGHVPGFAIVDMEQELSHLLGRKVDLRTPAELSLYFRQQVVKEARVIFEQP